MSLPASDLTKKPDMRTTMELGAVLPETAEVRDDHLFIGGVDMVELARKEGTALYVFDEADLRHRMEAYREAFRSRYENSDIIYASKAFLNKEVARIAEAEGLCLDVSGGGELACARSVDFPMERVFVHGNNKTPRELEEAISAGVGRIVLDSRIELARVNEIAEEAKPAVGRVDPLVERLSLTVDAANLELMRVDQILEDVTQITDSVSKAAGAVDTVTSAPIDLVNSLTGKLRSKFKPRYASDESVSLGAAADASAAAKAGRAPERGATVAAAVSAMGDAARAVVAEGKDRRAAVKAANAASQERAHDFEDQLSGTAGTIADAAVANANADIDTDAPAAPAATAPADPAAAASPTVSPNAAAAQAEPAPVGNSPYTVQ